MRQIVISLAVLALGLGNPVSAAEAVPEPGGYRVDAYRSPTPKTLSGARVIETAEAERLWRAGNAIFIDVMPRPPKPPNLPEGTIWRDPPRSNIPGSVWLANVGYGHLDDSTEDYFRSALARLAENSSSLMVFYCLAECWMSWNAAKRAIEWGHTGVAWYPEGTDGWAAAGLPLEDASPTPAEDL